MPSYFCMKRDSLTRDLDKNGVSDFLLSYTACGLPCSFGLFVCMNRGQENFLVHFTPFNHKAAQAQRQYPNPLLESSPSMRAEIWDESKDIWWE